MRIERTTECADSYISRLDSERFVRYLLFYLFYFVFGKGRTYG